MSKFMGEKFMAMIRDFKNVSVSETPGFRTMKAFYAKLLKVGFSEVEAINVVCNTEIDVNQYFADNYLEETTDIFADLALKIRKECNKVSPLLFSKYIECNKLTIKFTT